VKFKRIFEVLKNGIEMNPCESLFDENDTTNESPFLNGEKNNMLI